ncbi:DUF4238 domain-containing protein [Roseivirga echinicomitans]
MAELVKRQHFVPRTYLKHFGFDKGEESFIHVLPRLEKTPDKIFESNVKNVALQKHLYTLPGETVEQKMAIEKFYSDELESQYDNIYELLTNPEQKSITDKQRELVISTVITMFYRTTKWLSQHNGLMNEVFRKAYSLCEQAGKDYFMFEKRKISIQGKSLEQLTAEYNSEQQPYLVMTQLETAFRLITLRIKSFDGIVVSKLGDDNAQFITSDNPVSASNINYDHVMPFDPTNLLKLPLDSKHVLMIMPNGEKQTRNTIFRNELKGTMCKTQRLSSNYQQMQLSERFLFGQESALESYLSTKERTERPLSAAELEATTKKLEALKKQMKDLGMI